MKKFVTTLALALGALTLATTTHAQHFHPQEDASKLTNCDLLKNYRNDSHAVPGSYLEVNCDFGLVHNEVTITTDTQKLKPSTMMFTGCYGIFFDSVQLPKGTYSYAYQKISGGHSPNWAVLSRTYDYDGYETGDLPNMTDQKVHTSSAITYSHAHTLLYSTNFGSWCRGDDEKIAIYAIR